jgi:hypothetical protein
MLQQIIGHPSTADFIRIIKNNLIPGSTVTKQDIVIFGPDLGSLKGKTVCCALPEVQLNVILLPSDILEHYRDVSLAINVMRVNGVLFLVMTSIHIKFGTAEFLEDQKQTTIAKAINNVNVYCVYGFNPQTVLADSQFAVLDNDMQSMGLIPNLTSRNKHVPGIKQYIRTLKECVHGDLVTMPFKHIPKATMIQLVYCCVFWLNLFPPKDGLSKTLSPRALVTGWQIDYKKHCQLVFGTYVQTHKEHNNSMLP